MTVAASNFTLELFLRGRRSARNLQRCGRQCQVRLFRVLAIIGVLQGSASVDVRGGRVFFVYLVSSSPDRMWASDPNL